MKDRTTKLLTREEVIEAIQLWLISQLLEEVKVESINIASCALDGYMEVVLK